VKYLFICGIWKKKSSVIPAGQKTERHMHVNKIPRQHERMDF